MQIIKLTDRQKSLSALVSAKKAVIQADLDELKTELQAAVNVVNEIRSRIKPLKDDLVPYGKMEAAICNIPSRAQYFPEFAPPMRDQQFCDAFFEKMAAELEG